MKNYPSSSVSNPQDIQTLLRFIVKERTNDVNDFTNLTNRFMSGRKVGTIPSGSLDTADTDRVGDFNIIEDTGVYYLIFLIDNGGTAEWQRVALSSW